MKRSSHFVIRYGLLLTMLILFGGILIILDRFEIRQRTAVDLIVRDGHCTAYIARTEGNSIVPGDTLHLHKGNTEQAFVVEQIAHEPSYVVADLHPAGESAAAAQFLGPDSKTTVYLYTHSVKLRDLVFKKL